jgi:hypothetical protein
VTDEIAPEVEEGFIYETVEEAREYKGPPHTSHRNYAVDVDDKVANLMLVFTSLLQVVDELKNEDTRTVGLDLLRSLAVETKAAKLRVVEGGKPGLR